MFYVFVLFASADPLHISTTSSLINETFVMRWKINSAKAFRVSWHQSVVYAKEISVPSLNIQTSNSSEHKQAQVLIRTSKF